MPTSLRHTALAAAAALTATCAPSAPDAQNNTPSATSDLQTPPSAAPDIAQAWLDSLAWEARVLLVFPPPDADLAPLRATLGAQRAGLRDRDMVVILAAFGEPWRFPEDHTVPDGLAQSLRTHLDVPSTSPLTVVLIGKDTGVKDRAPRLDLGDVFAQIDAMPMRQRELRDRAP